MTEIDIPAPRARGVVRSIASSAKGNLHLIRRELKRRRQIRQRRATIRSFLGAPAAKCLHIGAGGNVLRGWLNTDLEPQTSEIIYLDVSEPLPFGVGTLDYIFSEHLIEHLPHQLGAYHLRECHRVLKPGGRVRVATPDLAFLIEIYERPSHTDTQARYIRRTLEQAFPRTGFYSGAFVLNHFVRHWGHQFIYDEQTLSAALTQAGFRQARRWQVGESDDPVLQNVEHHGDAISDEFNKLQTIVFEGTR